ncbi:MAG: hypothetical protein IJ190_10470 [Prevotella sp.]|nr:hypothetical protein [Prevotella sp.]
MLLTLYDRYHQKKADLSPNDSSRQEKEIQSDNILALSFTLYECVNVEVNDYLDFMGERYWAIERYRPNEVNSQQWSYDLRLYGIDSLIKRYLVLNKVDGTTNPIFTLTAPPVEHVRLIVGVINEEMGTTDWKVGTVEGTENVTVDYEGKYCHQGLEELAKKTGTEYWIEGTTVNLCRCEHGEEITMGYGSGLVNISIDKADNVAFYTRLFPVGSSRNIDPERYGYPRLHLPGGREYVDINTEEYGVIHHFEKDAFADIYPRRVGTVSSVRKETRTGDDGNPFDIYFIKDDGLEFDPNNYMLPGKVLRVSFQEGSEIAGLGSEEDGTYFFEVNYDSKTKEFEIITLFPYDDGSQLPGGNLIPAVGDQYILWNLRMPDEYYPLAEREYQEKVNEYNRQNALDVTKFQGQTDHVWIEDNDIVLTVGQRIRLESSQYFPAKGYKSTRITRISRRVNLPTIMDIELCDALSTGTKEKLNNDIADVRNYAKSIKQSISIPDIIKTGDGTLPTDNNLFSAKRVLNDFLSKNLPGTAKEVITFLKGIIVKAKSYFKGIENEGDIINSGNITNDGDIANTGSIATKNLVVTGKATFMSVEIEEVKAAGGMIVESPGRFRVDKVALLDDIGAQRTALNKDTGNTDRVIRCYQLARDDRDRLILNELRPGDQALCMTFNVDPGNTDVATTNRYWWRRVLAVSTTPEILTEDDGGTNPYLWADISLDDYDDSFETVNGELVTLGDSGTVKADVPAEGDETVVLGHRWGEDTDEDRQGAWVSSAYKGNDPLLANKAPYKAQYWGIDDYDLSSHLMTYFARGKNHIVGTVEMSSDSKLGSEVLTETLRGLRSQVNEVKSQADKQIVIWFGEEIPTLQNEPACEWADDEAKILHEKDLYYNKAQETANGKGRAWSWERIEGVWTWREITDKDVLASLEAAAAAQRDVNSVKTRLDDWASDGKISPAEKRALASEWAVVNEEYAQVCTDADRYHVSKTAYTTAYNSAAAAFGKYTAATPETITIEEDYQDIAAYYTALKNIRNDIAAAAQQSADEKCKVFVMAEPNTLPSPPYKVGDLWMNAVFSNMDERTLGGQAKVYNYDNDLLRCVRAKDTGQTASIEDWRPASAVTSARITLLNDAIEAKVSTTTFNQFKGSYLTLRDAFSSLLSEKFTFDEDGNVTNASQSGVVTTTDLTDALKNYVSTGSFQSSLQSVLSNYVTGQSMTEALKNLVTIQSFAGMFATAVNESDDIVKKASLSAFVARVPVLDEDGNPVTDSDGNEVYRLQSGVLIDADRIDFVGKTVINGKFTVDTDGNVTMDHFTATNATITGVINAQYGTFEQGLLSTNNMVGLCDTPRGSYYWRGLAVGYDVRGYGEKDLANIGARFPNQSESGAYGRVAISSHAAGYNPIIELSGLDGSVTSLIVNTRSMKFLGLVSGMIETYYDLTLTSAHYLIRVLGSNKTITLPASASMGQSYIIIPHDGCTLSVGNQNDRIVKQSDSIVKSTSLNGTKLHFVFYDSDRKEWILCWTS